MAPEQLPPPRLSDRLRELALEDSELVSLYGELPEALPSWNYDFDTRDQINNNDTRESRIISESIHESKISLKGIGRFISLTRLAWNKESFDDLSHRDEVIRDAPYSAANNDQDIDLRPVSFTEQITARHREQQVRRAREKQTEQRRLASIYGINDDHKRDEDDLPIRLKFKEERAVKKAEKKHKQITDGKYGKLGGLDRKYELFDRATNSETMYGKIRTARINRINNKIIKLQNKLYGTEYLDDESDTDF
ncbi:MAG: hypothetical protein NVSMB46_09550 [Candidatus Saccharimonadales bacterium]